MYMQISDVFLHLVVQHECTYINDVVQERMSATALQMQKLKQLGQQ
jgi:hypothetical protein